MALSPKLSLFISATDTAAGKTFVTCLLSGFLRIRGIDTKVFKPICCGGREDIERLQRASHGQSGEEINGFYYEASATPSVAAALAGSPLPPAALLSWCRERELSARKESMLWEGAGGWMVPISGSWCVADWAAELGFPVLLVVAERLGCLNHTLLTVRDLEGRGLTLAGIILNQIPGAEPAAGDHRKVLEDDFHLPVWGRIPPDANSLPEEIAEKFLLWISPHESAC